MTHGVPLLLALGLWLAPGAVGASGTGLAQIATSPTANSAPWSDWLQWERLSLPGVSESTNYRRVREQGREVVVAESHCSASAMAVSLDGLDLAATPRLRWSWRVDLDLPPRQERTRGGDDFAARVYVMFPFEPRQAPWRERLQHRLAAAFYGRPFPGRALNFVWSSSQAAGLQWDNPFVASSKMQSMGRGELGRWGEQVVDVADAYRRQFAAAPPQPLGLAIMVDSDNTCEVARARFAGFEFLAPTR